MASPTNETPLLELLAKMTTDSVAVSSLEPQELILVRIAALAAVDAPAISYAMNTEAAVAVGIDAEKVRGVLAAIAPIVGTARVVSATGNIVEALAIELEELEDEGIGG
jgi:alkylhydroperoxidase/carboxymuconolactone decarboxylase family protein YurZ